MFKLIVICSMVVFASAGILPNQHGYEAQAYDVHAPANYDFSYSVHDSHTGDVKEQQESRRGDAVQGSYSLVEPDGNKRTVHYADDGHSGFNAVVQREGTVHHQPIAHAAPVAVAHAAPVTIAHAAPVSYAHASPVAVAHAAPIAVAHAAPVSYAHASPVAVAHATPVSYSHASPVAIAHAAPAVAYSHQSYSAPVVSQQISHAAPAVTLSHQSYAAPVVAQHISHAAPIVQAYQQAYQQPIQLGNIGYAGQSYAGQGYAGHASGYSTVSQVTHHGGYHQ